MNNPTHRHRATALLLFTLLSVVGGVALAAGGAPPSNVDPSGTSSDVVLLVLYILLALVFSFLCSVAEAVLLSITPSFIAGLDDANPKLAKTLRKLKQEKVDRSLAAILTLNTIAHTVGAIGSGAKATAVFGSTYFGVFSAIMTLMILFLSEIIPKTLGAVYWRKLAGATARFIQMLIIALYPLILVSERLTQLLSRGQPIHAFNRDEFVALATIGENSGQINEGESRIIRNLFTLQSLKAEDIMTPRTVMVTYQQDLSITEVLQDQAASPFTRFPIWGENRDNITGFVLKDELFLAEAQGRGSSKLVDVKRELTTVPETVPLSDLLEFLLDNRAQLALVADNYGGTSGIVTLEDVIETLLGMEIVDEADQTADMQSLARKQWRKRASALGLEVDSSETIEPHELAPSEDKPVAS